MSGQPLPPGWEAKWDNFYGRFYFIDHAKKQTSWVDPRLRVAASSRRQASEHIPMQEFSSSAAELPSSHGQASTSHSKETGFQLSIDREEDEDDDEEWRNALLLSSMENKNQKHLMFHEKINMKEKFKRDFKDLDGMVVENTVEKHNFEEDIIRATLMSLKDAKREEDRKKRNAEERKRKQKEVQEKKRALQPPQRKLQELRDKMEAERIAKLEAEKKAKLEEEKRQKAAEDQRSTAQAKMTSVRNISKPKETQLNKPSPSPKTASTGNNEKQVYISANRLEPAGPQASLRSGPQLSNLIRYYSFAAGANKSLVAGPQRTNRQGPTRLPQKQSLSKGPNASLRQGPQCGVFHERQRSNLTGLSRSSIVVAI